MGRAGPASRMLRARMATDPTRTPAAVDPVSEARWWEERYREGDTGWDKGAAAPPIARLVGEGVVTAGPVAVLGAGRGHEALLLARRGVATVAVDFAEAACRDMRAAAEREGVALVVLQEDVFRLPVAHAGRFAAVLEHTCFCAIDPARRAEYADVVAQLLPRGGLFLGLFYAHGRPGGPPFATTEEEVRRLFGPRFDVERLQVAPDSFPSRVGAELEFVFRKR